MHALFGTGWTQHLVIQGSCLKDVCAIFDLLLEVIYLQLINMYVQRIQAPKALVLSSKKGWRMRPHSNILVFYLLSNLRSSIPLPDPGSIASYYQTLGLLPPTTRPWVYCLLLPDPESSTSYYQTLGLLPPTTRPWVYCLLLPDPGSIASYYQTLGLLPFLILDPGSFPFLYLFNFGGSLVYGDFAKEDMVRGGFLRPGYPGLLGGPGEVPMNIDMSVFMSSRQCSL